MITYLFHLFLYTILCEPLDKKEFRAKKNKDRRKQIRRGKNIAQNARAISWIFCLKWTRSLALSFKQLIQKGAVMVKHPNRKCYSELPGSQSKNRNTSYSQNHFMKIIEDAIIGICYIVFHSLM